MRWAVCLMLILFCGVTGSAGAEPASEFPGIVPALTEEQQIQLATADDTRPPDEPAWTGLLVNVASWNPLMIGVGSWADDSGGTPTTPDWMGLLQNPKAHRGELFVVDGQYAGRQREMRTLRAGPWGEVLKEWGVVVSVGKAGLDAGEVVAVVYLVDPEGKITPPREGQTVRVLTRFYKTWTDVDAEGVARTYPVFVGRSASVVSSDVAGGRGSVVVVGGVVVMAGVLGLVMLARKRRGGRASARERVLERLRREAKGDVETIVTDEEDLPDDPAAALEQLDRSGRDV